MQANPDRHASLAEAYDWIDAQGALGSETVLLHAAAGRALSGPLTSPGDRPLVDCAAWDGYAVCAAETEGAHEYSPLQLPSSAAPAVRTGDHLPEHADAVLAVHAVSCSGGWREVTAPVAAGSGVERRGCELTAGDIVLPGGRRVRPQDLALVAAFGITELVVARRPRVRLVVAHVVAPMLRALVTRDGGLCHGDDDHPADLVLVGHGVANAPAECLVSLRPGDRTGLGTLDGVPAVLLPPGPLACLVAYELLAGRAVRRLARLPSPMPHASTDAVLERKIVSGLGTTDLVQVRLTSGQATPLGSAESGGLTSAVRADGFVVVPEASEGCAAGSRVQIHLYDADPSP